MAKLSIVMKGTISQDKGRRYLEGVTSGLEVDHHGERMTEKCIKSFMDQANSGDVLLYPDIHGIRSSKDMGILEKAAILENGDWYTKYRLYDENDFNPGLHREKLATNDTLWRQINGLPPYNHAKSFGFSIEGIANDDNIIKTGMGTAMDGVELDGVVLVPRPAYPYSVANAIAKALGDISIGDTSQSVNSIQTKLQEVEAQNDYYDQKFQIDMAFNDLIDECLKEEPSEEKLIKYFDDYRDAMIPVLLQMASVTGQDLYKSENPYGLEKVEQFRVLKETLTQLGGLYAKRIQEPTG